MSLPSGKPRWSRRENRRRRRERKEKRKNESCRCVCLSECVYTSSLCVLILLLRRLLRQSKCPLRLTLACSELAETGCTAGRIMRCIELPQCSVGLFISTCSPPGAGLCCACWVKVSRPLLPRWCLYSGAWQTSPVLFLLDESPCSGALCLCYLKTVACSHLCETNSPEPVLFYSVCSISFYSICSCLF